MRFLLTWKTREREIQLGYAADFCPVCRKVRAFSIKEVRLARHLWFIIPTERGRFSHNRQFCRSCLLVLDCHPGRFLALSRSEGISIEHLIQTTFPSLPQVYADRLAIEKKVAAGGDGIDAPTRESLLHEAFVLAEPHFQDGFGREGRRILALALRPLWPSENEVRSCLRRYRAERSRMGAALKTAQVMASIYPASKEIRSGAFDY